MWKLEFSREALKALIRMPSQQARRIRQKLEALKRDPLRVPNVKKLSDHPGFRLRVGDWRIVYMLDNEKVLIHVIRIAPHGEVYR